MELIFLLLTSWVNIFLNQWNFKKENEPGDVLNFYIESPSKDSIQLISFSDNSLFAFKIVE